MNRIILDILYTFSIILKLKIKHVCMHIHNPKSIPKKEKAEVIIPILYLYKRGFREVIETPQYCPATTSESGFRVKCLPLLAFLKEQSGTLLTIYKYLSPKALKR